MPTRIPRLLASLLFLILFAATSAPPVQAQFSQILIQDNTGISGFDLYNNGLYYWRSSSESCADGSTDLLRWMPYRFDPTAPVYTRREACNFFKNRVSIVRDEAYYYFADGLKAVRKHNVSFASSSALVSNSSIADAELTALTLHEGWVYYGLRDTVAGLDFGIYRIEADLFGQTTGTSLGFGRASVAHSNYINDIQVARYGAGALGVFYTVGAQATQFGDDGLNRLYVKNVGDTVILPGANLASDVKDFVLRTGLFPSATTVWASRFEGIVAAAGERGTTGGSLERIDPATGSATVKYSNLASTVYSVAVDNSYYYFVENESGTFQIQRQIITSTGAGTTIQALSQNVADLTSDGDWLYYIEPRSPTGHYIRRLASDSDPVTLDVRALALEGVQTTQSLTDSPTFKIPLVAGKDTVVRAYGDLGSNTTGQNEWRVDGRLRVFDDGVLVSEFQPRFLARLTGFTQPSSTRPSFDIRNPDSFFFVVPGRFLTPGTMTFEVTLNESDLAPETESRANNVVSVSYETRRSGIQVLPPPLDPETPTIIFRPMLIHDQPTIRLRNVIGVPGIIERAKVFLPFSDVTVIENDSVLQKNILGIDLGPWTMPDEQNWALLNLSVSTLTSNYLYANVQVAMVARGVPNFNGVAFPITATLVRMEDRRTDPNSFNQPRSSLSLAHEWGHIAGILHIHNPASCGEEPDSPYEDPYPWDPCNMGPDGDVNQYYGFDRMTRQVIGPTAAGDLMSYRLPRWISGRYYSDPRWQQPTNINTGLAAAAAAGETAPRGPVAANQLVIGALYDVANGDYQIARLFAWPTDLITEPEFPTPVDAGFDKQVLTIRDSFGSALESREVTPFPMGEGDPNLATIYAWLPFSADAQSLEFSLNSNVTETIERSPNAPDVQFAQPRIDAAAGLVRLRWNAYDPDGDSISTMVLYSNDDGTNWTTRTMQTTQNGVDFPIETLPSGAACRFKLLFSDGMNTTVVDLDPIALANHPPSILIDGPADGSEVPYGELINLSALALDADQGSLPSEDLQWSISGQQSLAFSGSLVQLENLEPGHYIVDVEATDDEGATGSSRLEFDVAPLTIPELAGLPIELDGICDGAFEGGSLVRIPYSDGSYFEARLFHRDDRLYICFDGVQFREDPAFEQLVGIAVDVDNSGDATVQGSDVAYFMTEFGDPAILRPDGSGNFVPTFEVPEGFDVAVHRTADSWSAELCIADSNLGGWNHLVRIQLGQYAITRDVWPAGSDAESPATYAPAWFGQPGDVPQPAPLLPIANAGGDERHNLGDPQTLMLNGQGSIDPNGGDLTYNWVQTGGPAVTLTGADTATPSFLADPGAEEIDLTFELTVTNAAGSDIDTATISLAPDPAPFIFDVDVIIRHILGIEERPADMNHDDRVDVSDVIYFLENGNE